MKADDLPKSEEEYKAMLAALPEDRRKGFEKLVGTFKPWEKLNPELAAWITDEGPFGKSLKHPLVYDIMYVPGMRDGMLNDSFAYKTEALKRHAKEGNWSSYVFTHERPWRLHAFEAIHPLIADDCEFWDLVGHIWTDSENIWQNYEEWNDVLHSDRSRRECIMNEDERKFLADLPDEICIYRGYRQNEEHEDWAEGFSWTLERERGEWFARRLAQDDDTPTLVVGKTTKERVIAYFAGRNEAEIVVLPEHVEITEREEV